MNSYLDALTHVSPVWPRYTPIIASRAEGSYIYDQDGTQYLDFTCGIGVTNTGHCHPAVVEAIRQQAGRLLHGQVNIVFHEPLLELVEELRNILPLLWMASFSAIPAQKQLKGQSSWRARPPADRT